MSFWKKPLPSIRPSLGIATVVGSSQNGSAVHIRIRLFALRYQSTQRARKWCRGVNPTRSGETDRRELAPSRSLLMVTSTDASKTWLQSRRCNQIDCKQGLRSHGLSRKCLNPVESTILEEDIPYVVANSGQAVLSHKLPIGNSLN